MLLEAIACCYPPRNRISPACFASSVPDIPIVMPITKPSPDVTLVCLHYLGGNSSEWSALTDQLDPSFQVLEVDLPGFGSAHQVSGYSVHQMADYTAGVIARRASREWVLIGHSMGGKVAALLARRSEDGAAGLNGLAALVLIAASPPSPEPMEDEKRAELLAMFAEGVASRADAERYVAENTGARLPPPLHEIAVQGVLHTNPSAWRAWLQSGSFEDLSTEVGSLSMPALIIAGQKDTALGLAAQKRWTLPHLQNGVALELPSSGHLLPLERPGELAELIGRHVSAALNVDRERAIAGYQALINSPRVAAGTRQALKDRRCEGAGGVFSTAELNTLRALANCVVPEVNRSFDLAERIDRMLSEGRGDGWRPSILPNDLVAYRAGLAALNAGARLLQSASFEMLNNHQQDHLLKKLMDGGAEWSTASPPAETILNSAQLRVWFEDVRADLARLYMAHPETLAQIGYSGIANGGDGQPKSGFVLVGVGLRESWEPAGFDPAT